MGNKPVDIQTSVTWPSSSPDQMPPDEVRPTGAAQSSHISSGMASPSHRNCRRRGNETHFLWKNPLLPRSSPTLGLMGPIRALYFACQPCEGELVCNRHDR